MRKAPIAIPDGLVKPPPPPAPPRATPSTADLVEACGQAAELYEVSFRDRVASRRTAALRSRRAVSFARSHRPRRRRAALCRTLHHNAALCRKVRLLIV